MRNTRMFFLALAFLLSLAGCSRSSTADGSEPTDPIWDSPPALTVTCGESQTQALKGTCSWTWLNADGTSTSIASDSLHPLQAREYMTPLYLPAPLSDADPLTADLRFEAAPDQVSIRRWSGNDWDRIDAQSEVVEVSVDDEKSSEDRSFKISLEDGQYVYEVTAEWNHEEQYGGTASYSFYTLSTESPLPESGESTPPSP